MLLKLLWKPHRFECQRCGYEVRVAEKWMLDKIRAGHECELADRQ